MILLRMPGPPALFGPGSARSGRTAVRHIWMLLMSYRFAVRPLQPIGQGEFVPDAAGPWALAMRPGDFGRSAIFTKRTNLAFLNEINEAASRSVASGFRGTKPTFLSKFNQGVSVFVRTRRPTIFTKRTNLVFLNEINEAAWRPVACDLGGTDPNFLNRVNRGRARASCPKVSAGGTPALRPGILAKRTNFVFLNEINVQRSRRRTSPPQPARLRPDSLSTAPPWRARAERLRRGSDQSDR
jgi:hypothetical protein